MGAGPAIGHPFSVSVFEDWIYWSDWDQHTIMKANKFNGRNATSVTQTHSVIIPRTTLIRIRREYLEKARTVAPGMSMYKVA